MTRLTLERLGVLLAVPATRVVTILHRSASYFSLLLSVGSYFGTNGPCGRLLVSDICLLRHPTGTTLNLLSNKLSIIGPATLGLTAMQEELFLNVN